MKKNKQYIKEERRRLRALKHPPEQILKKINRQEEEISVLEVLHGFKKGDDSLTRWQAAIDSDDLPFGNPYSNYGHFF